MNASILWQGMRGAISCWLPINNSVSILATCCTILVQHYTARCQGLRAISCWLPINNSVLILATCCTMFWFNITPLGVRGWREEQLSAGSSSTTVFSSLPRTILHNVLVQHYTAMWQWMRGAIICWLPINNSVLILATCYTMFWFSITPLGGNGWDEQLSAGSPSTTVFLSLCHVLNSSGSTFHRWVSKQLFTSSIKGLRDF